MLSKKNKGLHKEVMAHWGRFLTAVESGDLSAIRGEDWHAESCAFCEEYATQKDGDECSGCPIEIKTGYTGCQLTPWDDVDEAIQKFLSTQSDKHQAAAITATKKEIAFLGALDDAD